MSGGERVKVPAYDVLLWLAAPPDFILLFMRVKKSEKNASVRRPDVRSLKIQPRIRDNRNSTIIAPEIKLCGNWLEQLGFHHGKRVIVTTMKELLIIRLQTE
jgi:hypothetical protein